MTHAVDYESVIKHARLKYNHMISFYGFMKSKKRVNSAMKDVYKGMCQSAFRVPHEIRNCVKGMNKHLEKMIHEGYLELKESDLSSEDPVTKHAYKAYSKIATTSMKN